MLTVKWFNKSSPIIWPIVCCLFPGLWSTPFWRVPTRLKVFSDFAGRVWALKRPCAILVRWWDREQIKLNDFKYCSYLLYLLEWSWQISIFSIESIQGFGCFLCIALFIHSFRWLCSSCFGVCIKFGWRQFECAFSVSVFTLVFICIFPCWSMRPCGFRLSGSDFLGDSFLSLSLTVFGRWIRDHCELLMGILYLSIYIYIYIYI